MGGGGGGGGGKKRALLDKNPVCPLVMFPTGLTLLSWPDIAHLKGTWCIIPLLDGCGQNTTCTCFFWGKHRIQR